MAVAFIFNFPKQYNKIDKVKIVLAEGKTALGCYKII